MKPPIDRSVSKEYRKRKFQWDIPQFLLLLVLSNLFVVNMGHANALKALDEDAFLTPVANTVCEHVQDDSSELVLREYGELLKLKAAIMERCDESLVRTCQRDGIEQLQTHVLRNTEVSAAERIFRNVRASYLEYIKELIGLDVTRRLVLEGVVDALEQTIMTINSPKDSPYFGPLPKVRPSVFVTNVLNPLGIADRDTDGLKSYTKIHPEGALLLLKHGVRGELMFGYLLLRAFSQIVSPRYYYTQSSFGFHPLVSMVSCLRNSSILRLKNWDLACVDRQVTYLQSSRGTLYALARDFRLQVLDNPYVGHRVPDEFKARLNVCEQGQVESGFKDWISTYLYFEKFLAAFNTGHRKEITISEAYNALVSLHCAEHKIVYDEKYYEDQHYEELREEILDPSKLVPMAKIQKIVAPLHQYFNGQSYSKEDSELEKLTGGCISIVESLELGPK